MNNVHRDLDRTQIFSQQDEREQLPQAVQPEDKRTCEPLACASLQSAGTNSGAAVMTIETINTATKSECLDCTTIVTFYITTPQECKLYSVAERLGLMCISTESPVLIYCRVHRNHCNNLGIELFAMFCCRFRHVLDPIWHLLVPDTVPGLRPISLCIVCGSKYMLG